MVYEAELVESDQQVQLATIRESASVQRWRAMSTALIVMSFFGFLATCAVATCGG